MGLELTEAASTHVPADLTHLRLTLAAAVQGHLSGCVPYLHNTNWKVRRFFGFKMCQTCYDGFEPASL